MSLLEIGGFTWEPEDLRARRIRIVGAVVLLLAGWATGFFAGRMSAWLMPVSDTEKIASAAAYMRAVAERAQPRADPKANEAEEPTLALSGPEPETASPKPAPDLVTQNASSSNIALNATTGTMPRRQLRTQAEPSEPQERLSDRGDTRDVNSHWRKVTRSPDDEDVEEVELRLGRTADAAIAACERRYNSFRRSDGTYQPYGGRPRELCPYLR